MKTLSGILPSLLLAPCLSVLLLSPVNAENPAELRVRRLDDVRARFASPPAAYRPAPLHVWNDDMEEAELARQLDEFREQGFGGVFVHPRPGLVTPYLSERWLELWRFTVDEARKRGMVTYIYDENSYPSGFAGGHVPADMPESREMHLRQRRLDGDAVLGHTFDAQTVALFRSNRPPAPTVAADFRQARIVIEPDGRSGRFLADGKTTREFVCEAGPLKGGIAFRTTVGRGCRIDDVRFYQIDASGERTTIAEDDFDDGELGSLWVRESLTQPARPDALTATVEDGALKLVHDGSTNDSWLRTDRVVEFEGKTTVLEFRLLERLGSRELTPSIALGTTPLRNGKTSGAILLELRGADPHVGWGMVNGRWVAGQARPVVAEAQEEKVQRISLPKTAAGTGKTGVALGLDPGSYIVYVLEPGGARGWYGGKTYVNLLERGVGEKFLEITLGAYDRVLSDEYGRRVLACFTDEPHAGEWCSDFAAAFETRRGYSILDHLPSVWNDIGDWRRVRHDYSLTILELWVERFLEPYHEACEERGIAFTGHVWEHSWPRTGIGPDTMTFDAWEHWPGIDCLMNRYSEGAHSQFGNYRASKEVRSIANQLDRPRTLCEAYGAGGWELTFQDMKRIGDWLHAGGINLLNPHLSYSTIRGARKRDHPQSFSYHAPWWEAYHLSADYFGRLSWALSAGEERNPILVIEPTTTAWMYNFSGTQAGHLDRLGETFQRYVTELGSAQVDFDLGSEPVMDRHARVDGKRLVVGVSSYDTVVLPPGLENLEAATVDLLVEFAEKGGRIVTHVGVPPYVNGQPDPAGARIAEVAGERWVTGALEPADLGRQFGHREVRVTASPVRNGRVLHYLRELDDGYLLFVSNASLEDATGGSVVAAGRRVELWNPTDGSVSPVPLVAVAEGSADVALPRLRWEFRLPPAGSALWAIHREGPRAPGESAGAVVTRRVPLPQTGDVSVEPLEPNVLPLDHVDLVLRGETTRGLYFYEAQTRIYRAHGFAKNPWDNAVQYRRELLEKDDFPADSGFELRYPFRIAGFSKLPPLKLVVERGDRYEVSVNGHVVKPLEGEWWLDRSFRVYSIEPECLRSGENVIGTVGRPFSIHHEPEPVYLLGDFSLASAEHGWTIEPPRPLGLGPWSAQGRPAYPGKIAYHRTVRCPPDPGEVLVELGGWTGTVARVDVNGETIGYIGWAPWQLEIGEALRPGENTVTVVVFGSLKNLLGPHHQGRTRGSAWPGMFWKGGQNGAPPGAAYDVIEYGLHEPFSVYRVKDGRAQ